MKMHAPQIASYTDYRDYLADWFRAAKIANPKVSFRFVARHLGLKAPNHFHLVISKKRHLSATTIEKVSRFLKLTSKEKQYLKILFTWDQATNNDDKAKMSERLIALRSQLGRENQDSSDLPIIGHQMAWYIKTASWIFEGKTREEITRIVKAHAAFPVSEIDVNQALTILETTQMLQFECGLARFVGEAIISKWDFDREEIKRHHASNLALAAQTLSWPIDERFHTSVTVPCSKELYDEFVASARDLCRTIFEKSNAQVSDPSDIDKVVTVQLAVFPFFNFNRERL